MQPDLLMPPSTTESLRLIPRRSKNPGKRRQRQIYTLPFAVPDTGKLELASIGSSVVIRMEPGACELTFEHGRDAAGQMWGKVYLRRTDSAVTAAILRADQGLRARDLLVMTAEPAMPGM
jgi:hypothetical protein